jgi:hypothetical protein
MEPQSNKHQRQFIYIAINITVISYYNKHHRQFLHSSNPEMQKQSFIHNHKPYKFIQVQMQSKAIWHMSIQSKFIELTGPKMATATEAAEVGTEATCLNSLANY